MWHQLWGPIKKIVYMFPNSSCDIFQLGSIMCERGMLINSQPNYKLIFAMRQVNMGALKLIS